MLGPEVTSYVRDNLVLGSDPRGKKRKWAGELKVAGGRVVALVDCRRPGKTMYVNRVEEKNIFFFLSNDPRDEYNHMLISEAALDLMKKSIMRFLVGENSKTFDLGEVIVAERVGEDMVRLERLPDAPPLVDKKIVMHFKHPTEERAQSLLTSLFPNLVVLYEPFSLNSEDGVYCVDFVIRGDGRRPTSLVGVEVKSSIDAWYHHAHVNARKIRLYHKLMNTECFVLVMEPTPAAFRLKAGDEIEQCKSLASFADRVLAELGLKHATEQHRVVDGDVEKRDDAERDQRGVLALHGDDGEDGHWEDA